MAEETRGQEPQEALDEQQVEGQEPQPTQPQEGNGQGPGGEGQVFTAEYVRELRQEAAKYRTKAQEARKALEQVKEMSQKERAELEARLAELEAKALEAEAKFTEATLRSDIYLTAVRKGFADPELAWRVIDPEQVEWDEESGKPKNLEALLDEALQKWPFLAGGGQTSAMNTQRKDLVFRRSQLQDPAFFAAHKDEIMQAMREGRIIDDLE